jgi:hypothetical protein
MLLAEPHLFANIAAPKCFLARGRTQGRFVMRGDWADDATMRVTDISA